MEDILLRSRAIEAFKRDVVRFCAGDDDATRVQVLGYAPRVKVERVLVQLLAAEPELAIERVRVRGVSGCSDFSGELVAETTHGIRTFGFTWCCRWRAEEEGWRDYFGFPDQIRAAREFGWDCFERWEERGVSAPDALGVTAHRVQGLTA